MINNGVHLLMLNVSVLIAVVEIVQSAGIVRGLSQVEFLIALNQVLQGFFGFVASLISEDQLLAVSCR